MSLVFVEGWELYDGLGSPPTAFTKKWGSFTRSWALNLVAGRHFGYGMQLGKDWYSTPDSITTPTFTAKSAWIVGMNIKRVSSHNGPFFRTYSGTTLQLEFRINNANIEVYRGGSTLIHTFTSVINTLEEWHQIQFKITTSTTTGSVRMRYNNFDVGVAGTSLNTDAASSGTCNRFMLTATSSAYQTVSWVVDDFWICNTDGTTNNDYLGAMVVEGLFVNGNGYQNDWTANATTLDVSPNAEAVLRSPRPGNGFSASYFSYDLGHPSTIYTWIGNNSSFAPDYHTNSVFFRYPDFFKQYKNTSNPSLVNFHLQLPIINGRNQNYRVATNTGNLNFPTTYSEGLTFFNNATSSSLFVDFNANGSNTTLNINITSIVTAWQAQGGFNENYDLILIIRATPTDVASGGNQTPFEMANPDYSFTDVIYGPPRIRISNIPLSNSALVNNETEADFVSANTIGQIDSYTLTNPVNVLGNVRGVAVNWQAGKGGPAASVNTRSFVRSGTTNGVGTTRAITAPYPNDQTITDIYELNPTSGTGWTLANLSDLEVGVEFRG